MSIDAQLDVAEEVAPATSPSDRHRETVLEAIRLAPVDLDAALSEPTYRALAALADDPLTLGAYATLADELAKANKSLRRADLDRAVGTFRVRGNGAKAGEEAEPSELTDGIEPWEDAVDGDAVAHEITDILARHCVLPKGAATAATLWALGAYGIDSFRLFPKFLVRSPQKRCGKSTLVEVMEAVTPRALLASNISAAAVFRCIEAWHPTLLIDEADTFLAASDDMRGILNSGHTARTARVVRVEGDVEREPRAFSTWAATLIAMIGDPPDTIADRSIAVTLERKKRDDTVTRLPRDLFTRSADLRRRAQRWAIDNATALEVADPTVPEIGSDRAEDNWRTLLAVADTLGGEWPERGRHALRLLEAQRGVVEDDLSIELLRDIRELFDRPSIGRGMFSARLVELLNELTDRPWPEIANGKELTARRLARLLQPYRIGPKDQRIGETVRKGYALEQFADAFARYLPRSPAPSIDGDGHGSGTAALPSATALHASADAVLGGIPSATRGSDVADRNSLRASNHAGCSAVADTDGVAAPPETFS